MNTAGLPAAGSCSHDYLCVTALAYLKAGLLLCAGIIAPAAQNGILLHPAHLPWHTTQLTVRCRELQSGYQTETPIEC